MEQGPPGCGKSRVARWRVISPRRGYCDQHGTAGRARSLALPDEIKQWSITTLRDRLVKIGAKIVRRGRSIIFQMAEVMVPRARFAEILMRIAQLRAPPAPA